ncbi:hypothetical protein BMS3Abin15_00256 [bacterium BMS3Abin15]|nr:hypothetical protein BMS3Abin15_00256 [bacterium BMS3Abin15]
MNKKSKSKKKKEEYVPTEAFWKELLIELGNAESSIKEGETKKGLKQISDVKGSITNLMK